MNMGKKLISHPMLVISFPVYIYHEEVFTEFLLPKAPPKVIPVNQGQMHMNHVSINVSL